MEIKRNLQRAGLAVVVVSLAACAGGATIGSSPTMAPGSGSVTSAGPAATPTPGVRASTSPSPSPSPTASTTTTSTSGIWVASWADAPTGPDVENAIDNMTIRELVKPTVGSRGTIRLHFSNFFGVAATTLGAVHVGIQTTGAGVTQDVPVTFGGSASVSVPAGGFVTSDTIAFPFSYGVVLAVTEYFVGTNTGVTFHVQGGVGPTEQLSPGRVTSYETAANAGNATSDTAGKTYTGTTEYTYLVDRVDVYGDYKESVVAFGSSTTDGFQSDSTSINEHMSWPEQLAAILHANGHDDIAIANEGISGNTVAYEAGAAVPATPPNPVFGQPGYQRFARDVLGVPNVKIVIDYLGANDLRVNCDPMASEIIPFKAMFYTMAHAAGVKIYSATTAPSVFCGVENPTGFGSRFPQGFSEEAERFQLLGWETATAPVMVDGTLEQPSGADGIIDFNGVLTDPTNLSYMYAKYDSGDDIHPNDLGYGVMAKAIPLSLL